MALTKPDVVPSLVIIFYLIVYLQFFSFSYFITLGPMVYGILACPLSKYDTLKDVGVKGISYSISYIFLNFTNSVTPFPNNLY